MDAIDYIRNLIKNGRKVGIFSCEDPYNTPFHRDLLKTTDYIHLAPKAAGLVIPESLDLGLQAKGINAWGIFGHYGIVNGHEVCAAISALNGHHSYGTDLNKHIKFLARQYQYKPQKFLKDNIIDWVETQHKLLSKLVKEKQNKDVVRGDIIIFAGLVENSTDGKKYTSRVLFSNQNAPRH